MIRRIGLLALASSALYAGLAALYPLASGLLQPRLNWAQLADGSALLALAHVGFYIALTAIYLAAINDARKIEMASLTGLVIGGWLLFSLVALFAFPGESADVFDYVFRGRMMTEYGLSPLNATPFEIKGMLFHRYVSWSEWVDAYGPLWEYASAGVSWLVGQVASPAELLVRINQTCEVQPAVCALLTKYVTGYRLLAMACTGVCGALVWSIVRRQSACIAPLALLMWLWNPLVIVSTAVGAHNDALMLVFILLAIWLVQRQHWLLGLLAVFAAAHVKLTALLMLLVMCLWLWRCIGLPRAIAVTALAIAIALPVSFALYAPLGGWATLPRNLYERTLLSTNSLGELLYLALRDGGDLSRGAAQQIVARVMPLAFVIAAAPALWRFMRTDPGGLGDLRGLVGASLIIVLLYLFLGSFWFQPWYLTWPIALAALLPQRRRLATSMAVLSGSALCAAVVSSYLRAPSPPVIAPWAIGALTVAIIWLPAAITYARLGVHLDASTVVDAVDASAATSRP